MKRCLIRIMLFLILGTITTIAVAWGCATWSPVGRLVISEDLMADYPGFGYTKHTGKIESSDSLILNTSGPITYKQSSVPGLPLVIRFAFTASAGWPLRCLKCDIDFGPPFGRVGFLGSNEPEIIEDPIDTNLWQYGIIIPPSFQPFGISHRGQLPIHPIWQGFAINTIFYAVIVWILWSSMFAARNFIRNNRGLCIKCGYDLRGTEHEVCPECGKA